MSNIGDNIVPILTSQDLKEMCERASIKLTKAEEDAEALAIRIKNAIEDHVKRTSRDNFGMTYSVEGDYKSVHELLKKYLPGVTLGLRSKDSQKATIVVMGPSFELL